MKVEIRNNSMMGYGMEVLITTDNQLMRDVLHSYFKVEYPNWYMMKKNNPKLPRDWDKCKNFARKLGDPCKVVIPFGLLYLLYRFCEEHNLEKPSFEELVAERQVKYAHYVQGIELDPVQVQVCKEMCASPLSAIELETASGKTEIMCNMVACTLATAYEKDSRERIVIIVPDIELLNQTVARLNKRLPDFPVGTLGNNKEDLDHPVVVTTFASACKDSRLAWRQTWTTVIVDEAHHSNAPKWKMALTTANNLQRLWALSGKLTYVQEKNVIQQRELESMFGPPVVRGKNEERLCPVTVLIYDSPKWKQNFGFKGDLFGKLVNGIPVDVIMNKGDKPVRATWHGKDQEGNCPEIIMDDYVLRDGKYFKICEDLKAKPEEVIYRRPTPGVFLNGERLDKKPYYAGYHTPKMKGVVEYLYRSQWALDLAHQAVSKGEPFVISVSSIFAVDYVTALCQRSGLNVKSVFGGNASNKQIIKDITDGTIHGAVGEHSKLSEGLDVPNLVHFIKLDGLWNEQKLEQQKGRVQRLFEGKVMGYVHIPADTHHPSLAKNVRKMENYFQAIAAKSDLTVQRINW